MPPISISSTDSLHSTLNLGALPNHALHLFPRSVGGKFISNPPPRPGFFSVLFKALTSLTLLTSVFQNINGIWRFVHPLHLKNTAIAQYELDRDWLDYHIQQWEKKEVASDGRMMILLAKEKPHLFAKGYITDKVEESETRKIYSGILKEFNPEYWEENKDVLGEAREWRNTRASLRNEKLGDIDDEMEAEDEDAKQQIDEISQDEVV
jgi:hypothetical protein